MVKRNFYRKTGFTLIYFAAMFFLLSGCAPKKTFYEKIEEVRSGSGMTTTEVEKILGRSPDRSGRDCIGDLVWVYNMYNGNTYEETEWNLYFEQKHGNWWFSKAEYYKRGRGETLY